MANLVDTARLVALAFQVIVLGGLRFLPDVVTALRFEHFSHRYERLSMFVEALRR
jgi:hypothetical protein